MPRLILVRHAPTQTTGRKLTGRQPGHPLSAAGREMAALTAGRFRGLDVAALHTSPLLRCRQTAAAIAGVVGLEAVTNRAFIEVDYGEWTGRTLAQLRRTRIWKQLFSAPSRVAFPGGESLAGVGARAIAGCEGFAGLSEKSRVVVVSHADVIKLILSHYLGQPPDLFQRLVVGPGSISVVDLAAGGPPRVPVVNYMGDLEGWL